MTLSFQQNKDLKAFLWMSFQWHWKQDQCQQNLGWMAAGEKFGIRKLKLLPFYQLINSFELYWGFFWLMHNRNPAYHHVWIHALIKLVFFLCTPLFHKENIFSKALLVFLPPTHISYILKLSSNYLFPKNIFLVNFFSNGNQFVLQFWYLETSPQILFSDMGTIRSLIDREMLGYIIKLLR